VNAKEEGGPRARYYTKMLAVVPPQFHGWQNCRITVLSVHCESPCMFFTLLKPDTLPNDI
jgi:hypothetical protein